MDEASDAAEVEAAAVVVAAAGDGAGHRAVLAVVAGSKWLRALVLL